MYPLYQNISLLLNTESCICVFEARAGLNCDIVSNKFINRMFQSTVRSLSMSGDRTGVGDSK